MSEIDRVLVFDIWGDYAHFKKIETTTSPLTYSIPTGTALFGIIAAIIGLGRNFYYDFFYPENAKFAMRILQPIKKIRINLNLIKTDKGFYLWDIKGIPRSPTPFEFVKQPKYRIYFWLKNKTLHEKLKNYLKRHQSFYTPYLGISELIANFKFVGELSVRGPNEAKEKEIHSVVRKDKTKLIVEENKRYGLERIPLFMDNNRVVQEYVDIFFEVNGKPLKNTLTEFYKVGEENVVFL